VVNCQCGGRVVTTTTDRDGERAHCSRCHSCVSISWLLHLLDEYEAATERAERKIVRLYQRGVDTTSALRDERVAYSTLAELSMAVVQDQDEQIARLKLATEQP
jgi:hypothetical protein